MSAGLLPQISISWIMCDFRRQLPISWFLLQVIGLTG
jgi:hypothetical protein